ncbi:MAG: FkbM family methyltransferase [Melioribacteraceae bacterium]|nr:FkbM family methyltransferase [Melioribacteraceae bacterium]MCF8412180.1 FkbM family methyltransferase [Melioribacteraceae bacterium]
MNRIKKYYINHISKRILNRKSEEFVHRSPFGFKLILNKKRAVDTDFYLKLFEWDTLKYFAKVISNAYSFVDIGANIGLYTLLAAQKMSSEGKIHSFEPSDWAHSRLEENIKINAFTNVTVVKKCAGDINGEAKFHITDDDAYNSIGSSPMNTVRKVLTIPQIKLDDYLDQNQFASVDVLKIDTEGADYLVLKGAERLLSQEGAPVIFFEYNRSVQNGYSYKVDEILTFLENHEYNVFELSKNRLVKFDKTVSHANELIAAKSFDLLNKNF